MNKQNRRFSMLATPLIIVCAVLGLSAPATAQSEERHSSCTSRTLSGDYGFSAEGVLIGVPGLPPRAPFRSIGLTHLDGKGNLTWVEHTVINGVSQEADWTAASGTYTVNGNCTGTAVVNTPNSRVPLNLFFVVTRDGKELHSVLDANAITTVFTKVE